MIKKRTKLKQESRQLEDNKSKKASAQVLAVCDFEIFLNALQKKSLVGGFDFGQFVAKKN